MKIYFDTSKAAHYNIMPVDPIAEIDVDTWSIYGRTDRGVGWDIIDGVFVTLISPEAVERIVLTDCRKFERKNLYDQSEAWLSKLEEQLVNGDVTESEYSAKRVEIMAYRKNVRLTDTQPDFPFQVTYPDIPGFKMVTRADNGNTAGMRK